MIPRPRFLAAQLSFTLLLALPLAAQSNTWVTKASLPTPRSDMVAEGVAGKLVVAGGLDPQSGILAQTLAYDPATNTWTTLAPMPTARFDASAAVVGGILYVIGGSNFALGGYLGTVEAYDPATDSWTTKAPMPTARGQAAVGVIDGRIYVAGGHGSSPELATLEVYDPATDTWTTKAPMPTARYGAVGGAIGGIFYVAGGARTAPGVTTYNVAEAYDPKTDSWSRAPSTPTPGPAACAAILDGMLYVARGSVEAFDPVAGIWLTKPPMPSPRNSCAAGALDDTLYVLGGVSLSTELTTIVATNEAFTPFEMVSTDIKPGDPSNTINLKSNGLVPVAILGSAMFDPMTVDPSTVTFAGAPVASRGRGAAMTGESDVNNDGYPDLILYFRTYDLQLTPASTEAVLYGTTYSGQRIRGSDTVRIVPPAPSARPNPSRGPHGPAGAVTSSSSLSPRAVPRGRIVRD